MCAGIAVTAGYMAMNYAGVRTALGLSGSVDLWFGIPPAGAGVFGALVGAIVLVVVSLSTSARHKNAVA